MKDADSFLWCSANPCNVALGPTAFVSAVSRDVGDLSVKQEVDMVVYSLHSYICVIETLHYALCSTFVVYGVDL